MEFIQGMLEFKWPVLLVGIIFLVGGIILLASGIKTRKQSKATSAINISIGIMITLMSLYGLFVTVIFGFNS